MSQHLRRTWHRTCKGEDPRNDLYCTYQAMGYAAQSMTHPHPSVTPEPSLELAERRTGMSFQRTRMSADRTLMSVMRTALSLITFGFTIFQLFEKLKAHWPPGGEAARPFGIALVGLGIAMLVLGIIYHVSFMLGLRRQRKAMKAEGLIHGESKFPPSLVLITAARPQQSV